MGDSPERLPRTAREVTPMDHERPQQERPLRVTGRREVLAWLGAAACAPLVGCLKDHGDESAPSTDSSGADTGATGGDSGFPDDGACVEIPQETSGPYPADGTNGPDLLSDPGVVRSDITGSFGVLSGVAEGVPLLLRLRVVRADGCTPLAGYAVYVWHCDRNGNYSIYNVANQNYLRGVQVTDARGDVTFASVFPGCYAGRWPHIHFEVYPSLAATSSARNAVATSQIALPQEACEAVYAVAGYELSGRSLPQVSLDTDEVFSDGAEAETPQMTGDPGSGYVVLMRVGVAG